MERTKNKKIEQYTTSHTSKGAILVCDPSMMAFGWSVVDFQKNIIDVGCIKTESLHKKMRTRKGDDTVRRIAEITHKLLGLIKLYNIKYIVSELPHGSQSATAAEMLGIVKGIVQTLADCSNIGIEWYSEGDCKKALFGDGKKTVSKADTIKAISKLYKVPWTGTKFRDEAIADSLAVHNVAYSQSSILKWYGNG